MNWEHPEEATLDDLIDHIFWIADKAGWEHVGLGSDFDGSASVVKGLEVRFLTFEMLLVASEHGTQSS
jgi:membrane dipeptidase